MTRPAASQTMKKVLLRSLFAATLMALIGLVPEGISAAANSKTWSVAVHIEYPDGFVYEHAFATGVPTSDVSSWLAPFSLRRFTLNRRGRRTRRRW